MLHNIEARTTRSSSKKNTRSGLQMNTNVDFCTGINKAKLHFTVILPPPHPVRLPLPPSSLSAPAPAGWWRKAGPRWRSRRCPGRAGRWPPAAAGPSRSPDPPRTPARWSWSWTGRPRCSAGWGWVRSGSPSHWDRRTEEKNCQQVRSSLLILPRIRVFTK